MKILVVGLLALFMSFGTANAKELSAHCVSKEEIKDKVLTMTDGVTYVTHLKGGDFNDIREDTLKYFREMEITNLHPDFLNQLQIILTVLPKANSAVLFKGPDWAQPSKAYAMYLMTGDCAIVTTVVWMSDKAYQEHVKPLLDVI